MLLTNSQNNIERSAIDASLKYSSSDVLASKAAFRTFSKTFGPTLTYSSADNLIYYIGYEDYPHDIITERTDTRTEITNIDLSDSSSYENEVLKRGDVYISPAEHHSSDFNGSAKFDGNGDYLELSADSSREIFEIGGWKDGEFTVEFWVKPANLDHIYNYQTVFAINSKDRNGDHGPSEVASTFEISIGATRGGWTKGKVHVKGFKNEKITNAIDLNLSSTTILSEGTWYHVAVVKKFVPDVDPENAYRVDLYIDGVSEANQNWRSNVETEIWDGSQWRINEVLGGWYNKLYIGRQTQVSENGLETPTAYFDGYLNEMRVSQLARYTANFTVPTSPFVATPDNSTYSNQTKLLIQSFNEVVTASSGNLTHIDSDDQGDIARGVWGDGTFIYLVNGEGGLHSYSVDGSGILTHIDSDDQGDFAHGVWGDGSFIYLANGEGGLHSYSVDGSGNLTHIDSDDQGGTAWGVWGDGTFIYLANYTGGLHTYSVDGSGNLTHIDSDDQGGGAVGVWGDGNFIYLANWTGGLLTYSVDGSGILTHIDSDDQGDYARDVWGDGNYIYLGDGTGGLHSYTVNGSGILTHIDSDNQGDEAWSVWGDGTFIYLANGEGGLHSYSVDGSGILTHIDSDDQGDFAHGVWGDGNFIYLANGEGGLRSYSVPPPLDGSVDITDSSPEKHSVTVNGAAHSNDYDQWGAGSTSGLDKSRIKFDSSGDSLKIPHSDDFNLLEHEKTSRIDLWLYNPTDSWVPRSDANNYFDVNAILSKIRWIDGNLHGWWLTVDKQGYLSLEVRSSPSLLTGSVTHINRSIKSKNKLGAGRHFITVLCASGYQEGIVFAVAPPSTATLFVDGEKQGEMRVDDMAWAVTSSPSERSNKDDLVVGGAKCRDQSASEFSNHFDLIYMDDIKWSKAENKMSNITDPTDCSQPPYCNEIIVSGTHRMGDFWNGSYSLIPFLRAGRPVWAKPCFDVGSWMQSKYARTEQNGFYYIYYVEQSEIDSALPPDDRSLGGWNNDAGWRFRWHYADPETFVQQRIGRQFELWSAWDAPIAKASWQIAYPTACPVSQWRWRIVTAAPDPSFWYHTESPSETIITTWGACNVAINEYFDPNRHEQFLPPEGQFNSEPPVDTSLLLHLDATKKDISVTTINDGNYGLCTFNPLTLQTENVHKFSKPQYRSSNDGMKREYSLPRDIVYSPYDNSLHMLFHEHIQQYSYWVATPDAGDYGGGGGWSDHKFTSSTSFKLFTYSIKTRSVTATKSLWSAAWTDDEFQGGYNVGPLHKETPPGLGSDAEDVSGWTPSRWQYPRWLRFMYTGLSNNPRSGEVIALHSRAGWGYTNATIWNGQMLDWATVESVFPTWTERLETLGEGGGGLCPTSRKCISLPVSQDMPFWRGWSRPAVWGLRLSGYWNSGVRQHGGLPDLAPTGNFYSNNCMYYLGNNGGSPRKLIFCPSTGSHYMQASDTGIDFIYEDSDGNKKMSPDGYVKIGEALDVTDGIYIPSQDRMLYVSRNGILFYVLPCNPDLDHLAYPCDTADVTNAQLTKNIPSNTAESLIYCPSNDRIYVLCHGILLKVRPDDLEIEETYTAPTDFVMSSGGKSFIPIYSHINDTIYYMSNYVNKDSFLFEPNY